MRRAGLALAALAMGGVLTATPAVAEPVEPPSVVLAQDAPSGPDMPPQEHEQYSPAEQNQRMITGAMGAVLIGLVLLTRRMRGKPVFWIKWKK